MWSIAVLYNHVITMLCMYRLDDYEEIIEAEHEITIH